MLINSSICIKHVSFFLNLGQTGGAGQPQSNAYFPLDGSTAGLGGAAGYSS